MSFLHTKPVLNKIHGDTKEELQNVKCVKTQIQLYDLLSSKALKCQQLGISIFKHQKFGDSFFSRGQKTSICPTILPVFQTSPGSYLSQFHFPEADEILLSLNSQFLCYVRFSHYHIFQLPELISLNSLLCYGSLSLLIFPGTFFLFKKKK